MKLYEINEEIQKLADSVLVDEATGEVLDGTEEILARIDALKMEKDSVLRYLAKLALNLRAERAACKAEEERLKERRLRLEKKEAKLLEVLDRECEGKKTDLGVATLSYRKTTKLLVHNAESAIDWLRSRNLTNCYRVPEPEVAKAEVKKLFAGGQNVPGCVLMTDRVYSLR